MTIRLVNDCGLEIDSYVCCEGENLNRALKSAMSEKLWVFCEGDTIVFDNNDEL